MFLSVADGITPIHVIAFAWLVWGAYWLVASFGRRRAQRREAPVVRLAHIALMGTAFALLYSRNAWSAALKARFLPSSATAAVTGAVLTVLGLAFSIWARYYLGKNWSAQVTIREGHQLVRSGPYAWIRHPIYTGMLIALAGAAITIGEYRAIAGVALVTLGFFLKARREEAFLAREFGSEFEQYRRHTGLFLPRVGARA